MLHAQGGGGEGGRRGQRVRGVDSQRGGGWGRPDSPPLPPTRNRGPGTCSAGMAGRPNDTIDTTARAQWTTTGLFLRTLNREFSLHQSANMGGTKGTQGQMFSLEIWWPWSLSISKGRKICVLQILKKDTKSHLPPIVLSAFLHQLKKTRGCQNNRYPGGEKGRT